MLAEREKCDRFMVTLGINKIDKTCTVFSAQFNPTPISMENCEEAREEISKQLNKAVVDDWAYQKEFKVRAA